MPKHPVRGDRKHLINCWNWKTLEVFEINEKNLKQTLLKYKNNPFNSGKWEFHSTIFQGPNMSLPGATLFDTIETATILSLELGKIKGPWKKLTKPEKNYQIIRKTLAILRKESSILPY